MRALLLPGRFAAVVLGLVTLLPSTLSAQTTHLVSTEAQLRAALSTGAIGDTVRLQSSITLTADLPTIGRSLTVDGAGFTLSGADLYRGLVVLRTGGGTAPPVNVDLQNLTIANTVAIGGAGGNGNAGGGGGAGLGGAIFVGDGANLSVSNVNVTISTAIGGSGGAAVGGTAYGGGGGMGGAGGSAVGGFSGGGGGFGSTATGGTNSAGGPGIVTGGGPGGAGQFPGGTNGGGGGAGPLAGGGGHLAGNAATTAGNGGLGGGGGGGRVPGSGGMGGGGGAGDDGGTGGYGGGGGGSANVAGGFGGNFGGDGGGAAGGGGGGAGLGGAIFVDGNGSITVNGPLNINGTNVIAGAGSGGGTNGQAHGGAMFLAGVGTIFFNTGAGTSGEIQDAIVDEMGAGLGDPGFWSVVKDGAGTVVLSGANRYGGETAIFGGTLQIANENNIGFGNVWIGDATLSITSGGNFAQRLDLAGLATLNVTPGATVNWNGTVADMMFENGPASGTLQLTGGGTLALNAGLNTYTGGTIVRGGSTLQVGTDAALGLGGSVTLGDGVSTGALSITAGASFASLRQIFLGAAGGIIDAQSGSTVTMNGVITGAGGLTKTGSGTLILNGANAYGGATSVDGGLLQAGAANIFSAAASLNVAAGAAVNLNIFDQSIAGLGGNGAINLGSAQLTVGASGASSLFGGTIGGTGRLVKTGGGVLALTGTNSYSGGTFVVQGVLLGTTTSLQGNIVNNALVVFDQAATGTYAGVMSGSGALVKNGSGTLVLSGANTYAGGTTVTNGILAGTTTSLRGTIVNNAIVMFDQAFTGTFAGTMSGTGSLVKTGTGTVTLNGSNTHAGGTAVNAGVLIAGASGVFGSGPLQIDAGALVDLANNSQTLSTIAGEGNLALGSATLTLGSGDASSAFNGGISGSGRLVKTGSGTLVLGGGNTYSGGTFVAGGALVGNSTSLQGHFVNDALVVFDQDFNGTFGGNMSGAGVLQKSGTGTLTITGTHTHSGGTVVTGGTLVGTAANLGGTILNDSSVMFGGAADGTFSGTLVGGGTFGKTGTGTLFLNGSHGHFGAFNVSEGTLALNGTLGSSVFVSPNATFRALGAVLGSVNVSGTLLVPSPPSSFAAFARTAATTDRLVSDPLFTVGGDLDLNPGSHLTLPVGSGPNPTILVGGAARLNGTTINVDPLDAGNQRATSFLAIAAQNGLTMTNTSASSLDPVFIPYLRQDRNMLFVTLLNLGIPLSTSVTDPNAASVGAAIDKFKLGATGDQLTVVRELTGLDDAALNDALRQISGEAHASLLQFGIRDSEMATDIVRRQISARRREILLGAPLGPSWWAQFGGERGRLSNAAGNRVGTMELATGVGGLDYRPSEKWIFGLGGGLVGGNMSLSDLSSSADVRSPRAFGYAGYRPKGFGVRGGGSFARQQSDTNRRIVFQSVLPEELGGGPLGEGINREAIAEEVTLINDQWSEYDDDQQIKTYTIDWLIGVRRASFTRRGFIESGADALSLLMPEQTVTLRQTNVMIHLWRREKDFRPFFEMLYRREMTDGETTTELEFPGEPDSRFQVDGLPAPKNILNARGGATMFTGFGVWTFEYQYRRATGQTTHTGDIRVRF